MKSFSLLCRIRAAALVTIAAAALLNGAPAFSSPYQLVAGDRLTLSFTSQGLEQELNIDIDGEVRLPSIGGVVVAGLTLDEAETLIETRLVDDGSYLSPEITLSVAEYAPVVVSGDVTRPGSFPYAPAMTVGSALALSGGSQASGVSKMEIDRARVEAEGTLRSLTLDIAASAVEIARIEASLADKAEYSLPDDLRRAIPNPETLDLDALMANEAETLSAEAERKTQLIASWDQEISTIEQQLELFSRRLTVQNEIVAQTSEDLATAESLQERGLQTASRLSSVEQREADARARVLEIESARLAATQALGDAKRAQAQFLTNQRETNLQRLQAARIAMASDELRYARQLEHLSILTGGNMGSLLMSDAIDVTFQIVSPRADRGDLGTVTPETRLLPGDMLMVSIEAATLAAN